MKYSTWKPVAGVVLLSASTLGACTKPTSPANATKPALAGRPARIDLNKAHGLPVDDDCKNYSQGNIPAIVINIPDPRNPAGATIYYYKKTDHGDEPVGTGVLIPPMPSPNLGWDIDARPYQKAKHQVILLKLVAQGGWKFAPGETIKTGDDPADLMFCVRGKMNTAPDQTSVKFYIHPVGYNTNNAVGSYTYDAKTASGIVRVAVDPDVDNNGFQ